jgi:hypothetical protein
MGWRVPASSAHTTTAVQSHSVECDTSGNSVEIVPTPDRSSMRSYCRFFRVQDDAEAIGFRSKRHDAEDTSMTVDVPNVLSRVDEAEKSCPIIGAPGAEPNPTTRGARTVLPLMATLWRTEILCLCQASLIVESDGSLRLNYDGAVKARDSNQGARNDHS